MSDRQNTYFHAANKTGAIAARPPSYSCASSRTGCTDKHGASTLLFHDKLGHMRAVREPRARRPAHPLAEPGTIIADLAPWPSSSRRLIRKRLLPQWWRRGSPASQPREGEHVFGVAHIFASQRHLRGTYHARRATRQTAARRNVDATGKPPTDPDYAVDPSPVPYRSASLISPARKPSFA